MSDAVFPPACADDQRLADLIQGPFPPQVDLNGIDFVEVDPSDHSILRITFLKPIAAGAYGILANPSLVTIAGGTRIVGITTLTAAIESPAVLKLQVGHGDDPPYASFHGGDWSPYVLTLPADPALDAVKRSTVFSFMAGCPTDVDCVPAPCPPEERVEPLLDYTAKDYASFRRLLIDLLPTLNPDWAERNPSDLGIALLELLAYEGDRLSYYQDAVANEAYLDTLRTRISARRHAKLVDYRMHDGRNAWAPVLFLVNAAGTLPRGTALFTKLTAPLHGQGSPPGVEIAPGAITVEDLQRDQDLHGVAAFETAYEQTLHPENNAIRVHPWGDEECCLAAATTEAYLYHVPDGTGTQTAVRPTLNDGDYLIFEEATGPSTGAAADADPKHRQLVRIEGVPEQTTDPLYTNQVTDNLPAIAQQGDTSLPLLHVRWRRADALTFPLCLSARTDEGQLVRNVSLARGNVVLADHGLTTDETQTPDDLTIDGRLELSLGPLTMECRPDLPTVDATGRIADDRPQLDFDVRLALPALALSVEAPTGSEQWFSVPDLLESSALDNHFVAEIDDTGRALIRFGDDEYGRSLPQEATSIEAVYRVGNGRRGNVGAEAIAHVAYPPSGWIEAVRNPLAAVQGTDPETIEQVRQRAPQAFHTDLYRAVTEADWAAAAQRLLAIAGAVATYRWTGSWYTVFVAVDPTDRADLVDLPNGRTQLEPAFEQVVRTFLNGFGLAGYDIELRPPRFVPVDLAVEVCTLPGHFRTDVAQAVRDALSDRVLPDGSRGFFHPSNFTFGLPLYLGRLYAAVERVEGVESVAVRKLTRYGEPDAGELAKGLLAVGPWEIVRLENDPNFVEHGVLTVTAMGGKT
jgi:hypothetical protein